MSTISILIIGRNEAILNTVVNLVNAHEDWSAMGAQTDAEAISLIHEMNFALILFTNGIDEASEKLLREHIVSVNPSTGIIQHYGGGSGLLSNEIMYALQVKNS